MTEPSMIRLIIHHRSPLIFIVLAERKPRANVTRRWKPVNQLLQAFTESCCHHTAGRLTCLFNEKDLIMRNLVNFGAHAILLALVVARGPATAADLNLKVTANGYLDTQGFS